MARSVVSPPDARSLALNPPPAQPRWAFAFLEPSRMNAPAPAPIDQSSAPSWVRHAGLRQWVSEVARLAKPERIVWCDGSQAEYDRLCEQLVEAGTFIRLNPKLRPNSFLARSHP